MWLGEVFTELGHQAVPALNCQHALAMTKQFELQIAAVVINPELRGAARIIKTLTATYPEIRIIRILSPTGPKQPGGANGHEARPTSGIRSAPSLERPSPGEPISRQDWVAKVRRTLTMAATR